MALDPRRGRPDADEPRSARRRWSMRRRLDPALITFVLGALYLTVIVFRGCVAAT